MRSLRIVLPLVAVMIGFGIAHARAEEPTPPVDAARLNERYAIAPGSEALFGDMLGKGETLAGGCTLSDGQIERTSVLATYTCGERQVVLQLLHPTAAKSGGVRTNRFAVDVRGGAAPPPDGLVAAVADRIRAREAGFEWTDVGDPDAPAAVGDGRPRWLWLLAGGATMAILVLWGLRRRTRQRAGND